MSKYRLALRLSALMLAFVPLLFADEVLPLPTEAEERGDHFFSELVDMASTLGIILLGLLIVTWFLKRSLAAKQDQLNVTSAIKILERRSLAPKVAVYILEIWGTRLIVGETPAGLVRLGEIPAEPSKFATLMQNKPENTIP